MNDQLEKALNEAITLSEQDKAQIRERLPMMDEVAKQKLLVMLQNEEAILLKASEALTE